MEYTPDHQIKLQIPTAQPDVIIKSSNQLPFYYLQSETCLQLKRVIFVMEKK